jgi:hypothetical protein
MVPFCSRSRFVFDSSHAASVRRRVFAQNKLIVLAALVAGASAFSPAAKPAFTTKLSGEKVNWDQAAELGWSMGGEDYTREVKPHSDPDSRKSIHDAPSFEEYMRMRQQGGN